MPQGPLTNQGTPKRAGEFLRRELPKLDTPVEFGHKLVFQDPKTGTAINFTIMGPKEQGSNTVVGSLEIGVDTTHDRIKAAIHEKATKYGRPDKPFLVVIWPKTKGPLFSNTILRGVYGELQIDLVTHRVSRTRRGAVTKVSSDREPINTRISSVGIYSLHFNSQDRHEHRFAIFHNPFAAHPLDPTVFREIPQFVLQSSGEADLTLGWFEDRSPDWWKNV